MTQHPPQFKSIKNTKELRGIVDQSRFKPVLVFKHEADSPQSVEKKEELENTWSVPLDLMDLYLIEKTSDPEVSEKISSIASVENAFPQIILLADGVTMYDETGDLISMKKIKLALKIVNRTFKWSESRA